MPLVTRPQGLVLVCLNGCAPPKETRGLQAIVHPLGPPSTMRAAQAWYALAVVEPPDEWRQELGRGLNVPVGPVFMPGSGTPVRLYVCEVCGYSELYAGGTVDPKTWGAPVKTGPVNG